MAVTAWVMQLVEESRGATLSMVSRLSSETVHMYTMIGILFVNILARPELYQPTAGIESVTIRTQQTTRPRCPITIRRSIHILFERLLR